MRIMLGQNNEPSLLVTVDDDFNPLEFDFRVVNGAWDGKFTKGYITVLGSPDGDFSSLMPNEILVTNQDRLRGDYQDVFDNFDNEDYVAPESLVDSTRFSYMDDDIPF